jgi:integration host factor subunit beta
MKLALFAVVSSASLERHPDRAPDLPLQLGRPLLQTVSAAFVEAKPEGLPFADAGRAELSRGLLHELWLALDLGQDGHDATDGARALPAHSGGELAGVARSLHDEDRPETRVSRHLRPRQRFAQRRRGPALVEDAAARDHEPRGFAAALSRRDRCDDASPSSARGLLSGPAAIRSYTLASWPVMRPRDTSSADQFVAAPGIIPNDTTHPENTMTKSDLIAALAARTSISNALAEQIVSTIFDSMTDALVAGERIELRGFGTFTVRSYDGYTGRNPRSGEAVEVAPKKLPFFKVGRELKELVGRGRGGDGDV